MVDPFCSIARSGFISWERSYNVHKLLHVISAFLHKHLNVRERDGESVECNPLSSMLCDVAAPGSGVVLVFCPSFFPRDRGAHVFRRTKRATCHIREKILWKREALGVPLVLRAMPRYQIIDNPSCPRSTRPIIPVRFQHGTIDLRDGVTQRVCLKFSERKLLW